MTDRDTQEKKGGSNMEKDPDDWTTGEEAGETFDADLTKAEASRRIDALQKTGRGT